MENEKRKWLLEHWSDQPVSVLSLTRDASAEPLNTLVQAGRIKGRCAWVSEDGPIGTTWKMREGPSVYVLDGQGIIRFRLPHDNDLRKAVASLLAKSDAK